MPPPFVSIHGEWSSADESWGAPGGFSAGSGARMRNKFRERRPGYCETNFSITTSVSSSSRILCSAALPRIRIAKATACCWLTSRSCAARISSGSAPAPRVSFLAPELNPFGPGTRAPSRRGSESQGRAGWHPTSRTRRDVPEAGRVARNSYRRWRAGFAAGRGRPSPNRASIPSIGA